MRFVNSQFFLLEYEMEVNKNISLYLNFIFHFVLQLRYINFLDKADDWRILH